MDRQASHPSVLGVVSFLFSPENSAAEALEVSEFESLVQALEDLWSCRSSIGPLLSIGLAAQDGGGRSTAAHAPASWTEFLDHGQERDGHGDHPLGHGDREGWKPLGAFAKRRPGAHRKKRPSIKMG